MSNSATPPGGLPGELIDLTSLGTFTGLTAATMVVTNAVGRATGWSPAWFGLAVAMILCEAVAIFQPGWQTSDLLLAALNACLVYLSASGASATGTALVGGGPLPPPGAGRDGFWQRWH